MHFLCYFVNVSVVLEAFLAQNSITKRYKRDYECIEIEYRFIRIDVSIRAFQPLGFPI